MIFRRHLDICIDTVEQTDEGTEESRRTRTWIPLLALYHVRLRQLRMSTLSPEIITAMTAMPRTPSSRRPPRSLQYGALLGMAGLPIGYYPPSELSTLDTSWCVRNFSLFWTILFSSFDRPLTLVSVFNIVYFTLNILGVWTSLITSVLG